MQNLKDGLDFLAYWFKIVKSFTWILPALQPQPRPCKPPFLEHLVRHNFSTWQTPTVISLHRSCSEQLKYHPLHPPPPATLHLYLLLQ